MMYVILMALGVALGRTVMAITDDRAPGFEVPLLIGLACVFVLIDLVKVDRLS